MQGQRRHVWYRVLRRGEFAGWITGKSEIAWNMSPFGKELVPADSGVILGATN
jgi:hypothetical protein